MRVLLDTNVVVSAVLFPGPLSSPEILSGTLLGGFLPG